MAQIQGGGTYSFMKALPGRLVEHQSARSVTNVREVQKKYSCQ